MGERCNIKRQRVFILKEKLIFFIIFFLIINFYTYSKTFSVSITKPAEKSNINKQEIDRNATFINYKNEDGIYKILKILSKI